MKRVTLMSFSVCVCLVLAVGAQALPQKQGRASNATPPGQAKAVARPTVEYLRPSGSTSPYSEAVRVGDLLILSGKLGTDSSGKLVTGGIKAETRQTMERISQTLENYGSSLDHVVKCTVMLADMKEWGEMNEVYTTFFKKERLPARSALGVNGLALGARVEIECWAVMR